MATRHRERKLKIHRQWGKPETKHVRENDPAQTKEDIASIIGSEYKDLRSAQLADWDLRIIHDYVKHGTLPENPLDRHILCTTREFVVDNHGILYHLEQIGSGKQRHTVQQLVVPRSMQYSLVLRAHTQLHHMKAPLTLLARNLVRDLRGDSYNQVRVKLSAWYKIRDFIGR